MPVIACKIDMFLKDQTIIYDDKTVAQVPIENLSSCLVGLCYNLGAYQIKLSGNKNYLDKVQEEIKNIEVSSYATNKIEVEII